MTFASFADGLAAALLLAGCVLTLAAGVGITRFPDLLARIHAAAKPQVLGLLLVLSAEALRVRSWPVLGMLVVVVIFQFLTIPVAAHMVARGGYRTEQLDRSLLVVDDLRTDMEAAAAAEKAPTNYDD
ncbi:monovalent cation/H(+) antiporter subunit G [Rarobacter incanus]|uniref:Multisubunit sodium/proton antiporter MrpG subunit n=1 Tax=Rarobacter incanus TaxID=153494 RepID=A0A542SQB6_9MICO|nr:monovalent cation/H(+) antiporter subunit G [Rarobacter incanus]TQK76792.1 multisubunit sodium/proton antiporter MrpG subunit [Rarobacter incanus]